MASKKQVIDPAPLIEKLAARCLETKGLECSVLGNVIDMLRAAPSADVVEVVRCKDCKHYKPRSQSVHWEHTVLCCARSANLKFPPDGFCSYGERKDNDS